MKNNLGKNKLERQIARAKKWAQLNLVEASNSQLKIDISSASENHYLVNGVQSKNGEWLIVKPDNCGCEKPHFFKSFGTVKLSPSFHGDQAFVVMAFDDRTKKCFAELSSGADDVEKLSKIDTKLFVKKN